MEKVDHRICRRQIGHWFASTMVTMSAVIAVVRRIANGIGRRADERFCLIYEMRLVDTNGFAFIPSEEFTEDDVLNKLIDAGYGLRDALRLILDARLARYVRRWTARPRSDRA